MVGEISVLRIAIDVPLKGLFEYLPNRDIAKYPIGSRVLVNFRNKETIGLIVSKGLNEFDIGKIKPVIKLIDHTPILNEEYIDFIRWSSNYYLFPLGEFIWHVMPKFIKIPKEMHFEKTDFWHISEIGKKTDINSLKRSKLQRYALSILQSFYEINEYMLSSFRETKIDKKALNRLVEMGLAYKIEKLIEPKLHQEIHNRHIILTDKQQSVLSRLSRYIHTKSFSTHLIYGVTGCGKTEIYISFLNNIIESYSKTQKGIQLLFLLPEIALAKHFINLLQKSIKIPVAIYNSSMVDSERKKVWQWIEQDYSLLIIGTRSSLFLPWRNLSAIIIDEEHDSSYKQQQGGPKYHAKNLAIKLAQIKKIPAILGSGTPSLESFYNALSGKYRFYQIKTRISDTLMPEIKIFDTSNRLSSKNQTLFLSETIIPIKQTLKEGYNCLTFINKRGFSPILYCPQCHWKGECPRCSSRTTVHMKKEKLICHHCSYAENIPNSCPSCSSLTLKYIGFGSERLEAELSKVFNKYGWEVYRVDSDAVKENRALIEEVHANMKLSLKHKKGIILTSTQILSKGYNLPNLQLVVVPNIDAAFYSGDIFAIENTTQNIFQAAGRAGRVNKRGLVIIQTMLPNEEIFRAIATHDYTKVLKIMLKERQLYRFPPFERLININVNSIHENNAQNDSITIKNMLQKNIEKCDKKNIKIIGPIPSLMYKQNNRYNFNILLKSSSAKSMNDQLNTLIKDLSSSKIIKSSYKIDVDPINFM